MSRDMQQIISKNEVLEILFDKMPYVFWKGKDGKYQGANSNYLNNLGLTSPDEFVGKTIFEVLKNNVSLAKSIEKTDSKIMNNNAELVIEENFITASGCEKTYISHKAPIHNKSGKVIGLVGFCVDITDLKIQQKQTEEENQRLISEKHQLEITAYQEEKKSQERFIEFINKIQNEVQAYKIETLNNKMGINMPINEPDKQISLTKREQEVLYYLSLNKSPKEIAQIFSIIEKKSISFKTVQSIIDKHLYLKFGVFSIGQLIEKAHANQLIPFLLPQSDRISK